MRRTMPRLMAILAITPVALVVAGLGCGGPAAPSVSGSSTEAKVSGKVLVRGQPAKGGTVRFNPSNVKRKTAPISSTEINPDGTYELSTLIGENLVSFGGPQLSEFGYDVIPVDVAEGENTIDLELPVPSPEPVE